VLKQVAPPYFVDSIHTKITEITKLLFKNDFVSFVFFVSFVHYGVAERNPGVTAEMPCLHTGHGAAV
jgi:hypothetical protein